MKDKYKYALSLLVFVLSMFCSCGVRSAPPDEEVCLALAKAKQVCLAPAVGECCGCCEGGECKCEAGNCKCGDCCSCKDCPGKRAKNSYKAVKVYQAGYRQALQEDKPFVVCVGQPEQEYVAQLPEVVVVPVPVYQGDPTPRVVVGVPLEGQLRTFAVYPGAPPVTLIRQRVVFPRLQQWNQRRLSVPAYIPAPAYVPTPTFTPVQIGYQGSSPASYSVAQSYPPAVRSSGGGGC